MLKTDILIIGAGAVGTALARELSKFKVRVLVCDKNVLRRAVKNCLEKFVCFGADYKMFRLIAHAVFFKLKIKLA